MALIEGWRDYLREAEVARGLQIAGGRLWVLEGLHSPELHNQRDILVYLPDSYLAGQRRYPVLYMHDGQNLFDPQTSYAGEWGVDEALASLSKVGIEAIVVGIPHMGEQRLAEYSPFPDARLGGGDGDDYLDFVTKTLKPRIDRDLRTLPGRESTGILGSSMGGLISLYAYFQHPEVFGLAGVMSPSLWFGRGAIFHFVETAGTPRGRLYLDVGRREGPGMVANGQLMRDLLQRKGYILERDLHYLEDAEGVHNEATWGRRLRDALLFLLSGPTGLTLPTTQPVVAPDAAD